MLYKLLDLIKLYYSRWFTPYDVYIDCKGFVKANKDMEKYSSLSCSPEHLVKMEQQSSKLGKTKDVKKR